jgi:hydroxymethylbilane synthase
MTASTGTSPLRLGTRRSALAMVQAELVAGAITSLTGRDVELVPLTTSGDTSSAALTDLGGTGVFVSALREALCDGDVDLAVHSLKDLPTGSADGLRLAAIPRREDPRDVLVARDGLTLGELPSGSQVGTGSPRRAAQLRARGLGLDVVPVRGNVDTRLRLVGDGAVDAVVLARAGLARLGHLDEITEVIDPIQMLPAPGQGALAVECREPRTPEDAEVLVALQRLDDPLSRLAVTAERDVLSILEAGCLAPVGAYAEAVEGEQVAELYLRVAVVAIDGSVTMRRSITGPLDQAQVLAQALAAELLAEGAADLMGERVT